MVVALEGMSLTADVLDLLVQSFGHAEQTRDRGSNGTLGSKLFRLLLEKIA